jgi:hypothetical protein
MFGGNPGEASQPNLRLDDFWELHLTRPSPKDILRKAQFHIRKQRFIELSQGGDKVSALQYLQVNVSKVVNHDDPSESQTFRELAMYLFAWNGAKSPMEELNVGGMAVDASAKSGTRALYRQLCCKNHVVRKPAFIFPRLHERTESKFSRFSSDCLIQFFYEWNGLCVTHSRDRAQTSSTIEE